MTDTLQETTTARPQRHQFLFRHRLVNERDNRNRADYTKHIAGSDILSGWVDGRRKPDPGSSDAALDGEENDIR